MYITSGLPVIRPEIGDKLQTHYRTSHATYLLLSQRKCGTLPVGNQNGGVIKQKTDLLQGTLALMVLNTLDALGPPPRHRNARRIEEITVELLSLNQRTLEHVPLHV